jgi:hypothetical protein
MKAELGPGAAEPAKEIPASGEEPAK